MKKLNVILTLGLLVGYSGLNAQQDPQFTQYFDNMLHVNPAYAGSADALSMTALHREQWVGFDGRPRSTTFSIHTPFGKNVGGGLTAVNDRVGPVNQTMVYGDLSYSLRFKNSKSKLAFGVKGGVNVINTNSSDIFSLGGPDPELLNNVRNRVMPNFGAGIYYYSPKWFIGVSSPKLLEDSYDGLSSTALERRHYFLSLGGVMKLNHSWKLRPTTMVKVASGAPLACDLTAAFVYVDTWWLGVSHRIQDSFGAFVQFQMSPQFKAGLAYDYTISALSPYNSGTFEVMLNYDFKFNNEAIRSTRYF